LPAPWEAVENAKKALRKDRVTRICCFSPCMEQVLRTVNALNEAGFSDITMYETLIRPHEVNQIPALKSVSEISETLKLAEKKREEKRLRQIALSRSNGIAKRKRGEATDEDVPDLVQESSNKRIKADDEDEAMESIVEVLVESDASGAALSAGSSSEESPQMINVPVVLPEVRGHTSYLTFACLVPCRSMDSGTTESVT